MAARNRLPIVALLAVISLVALPADAEPTLAEMDEARAFLKEGRDQLKAQQVERAAKLLEKAHRIMHVPPTGLDLMDAYARLDKLVEAWAIGEEIQQLPAKPSDPPAYADARKQINEAMEALATRIPTIQLHVTGTVLREAHATIDGVTVMQEPLDKPIRVNPGVRRIRVTATFCLRFETTQETEAGVERHYDVDVKLTCKAPAPELPPSPPTTPVYPKRNWIIAGSVVAGGFALASVGMAINARHANDQAVLAAKELDCTDREHCKRVYAAAYDLSTALGASSIASFGLAVGLGVTTLVYSLRGRTSSEAAAQRQSSLYAVPTVNGVVLGGAW